MLRIYNIASKNLIYSAPMQKDDFLGLCQQMENQARISNNYEDLFLIQQIVVNSYCLNGDVGLAVNKAQKMYEEAKKLYSEVGLALSIQAIGDTHMHSTQYKQAIEAFNEASTMMQGIDNNLIKVRLLIQQMHASMLLEDATNLQRYLIDTRKLLDRIEIHNKNDYAFYLQCFQAFYDITMEDKALARLSFKGVAQMQAAHHLPVDLFYFLGTRYYNLIGDYDKALAYCDSALLQVNNKNKLNEYKNLIIVKADLLAKKNEKTEACAMYQKAQHLSDSLNMIRYAKQVDSLRVNYWVDQIELENKAMNNRFLAWSVISAFLILGFVLCLIYVARKKNKRLIKSRMELEMVRKEAKESIQSKSLFLSNMSHELRTPLNAIVGFADLLACEVVEDAESKQQFGERINQNAQLLLKLFNDVADLSGLKKKNITFSYDTYDAVVVCRNVVDTVENVKQTSATLHFTTSLESLPLYTDTGRLQQLLINLLINATKFTQQGTITLILKLDEEHQKAVFMVEDTGCGIPLDKQPHIFERFEKLHDGVQGAGLGLSICQLIVEHMGGNIWIDSEYTKGARFVFTHPLTGIPKPTDNE